MMEGEGPNFITSVLDRSELEWKSLEKQRCLSGGGVGPRKHEGPDYRRGLLAKAARLGAGCSDNLGISYSTAGGFRDNIQSCA